MQTVLIHSAFALFPMLEFELDIAQQNLDKGNHVIFLICGGQQLRCSANFNGSRQPKLRYCAECRSRANAGMRWLKEGTGRLTVAEFNRLERDDIVRVADFKRKLAELNFQGDGLKQSIEDEVLQPAMSTLMTDLADSMVKPEEHASHLKGILIETLVSQLSSRNHIKTWSPDTVYLYNGRISRYNPMLRICKQRDVRVLVYEYPLYLFENYWVQEGQYIHDLLNTSKELFRVFSDSPKPMEVKLQEGAEWFHKRFKRKRFDVSSSYVHRQTVGMLPPDWDAQKFNIAIFNTSDFELGGVPEFRDKLVYESQEQAIRAILKHLPHRAHLTLRLHPNLSSNDRALCESLYRMGKQFVNCSIVPPDSLVDSYMLMNAADVVITFCSTVTVEAAFIGKPVICIGPSWYNDFNVAAAPTSCDAVMKLIRAAMNGRYDEFPNEDQRRRGACAFGFAWINAGVKPLYVRKTDYIAAHMVRGEAMCGVAASLPIRLLNRLIDCPPRLRKGWGTLLGDPAARRKLLTNPIKTIGKNIFTREI